MRNALNFKLWILQSSGEIKELKHSSNSGLCYPQRNFSQTHKECIFHLDKVLSGFPPRASAIISTGKINEVLGDHSQQLQE